jgi:hypothetical protein
MRSAGGWRRTFSHAGLAVDQPTESSRHQTLVLYRRLLRAQKAWPTDSLRPTRNIKEMLSLKIREEFRRCVGEQNSTIIQKCLQDGKRQLHSLHLLLNNTYALRYPIDGALLDRIRPSTEFCSLLSTQSQEKLARESGRSRAASWVSRFLHLFRRKTTSSDQATPG